MNWNALIASCNKKHEDKSCGKTFPWHQVNDELPSLSMVRCGKNAFAIDEIYAFAKHLEYIAANAPESNRREILSHSAAHRPYVFVRENDDLYYLCNRGYERIGDIAFSMQHLEELGIFAWNDYLNGCGIGDYSNERCLIVAHDHYKYGDTALLRRTSRIVASIAKLADALCVENGNK